MQAPPYKTFAVDIVTAYLHIVALHTWIRWRQYMWDPNLVELLQLMGEAMRKRQWPKEVGKSLVHHIRWFSRALLVLQVVVVIWGYQVLPMPAMEFAMDAPSDASARSTTFAFAHSVMMFLAIPGHVPSLLAGYGFFLFVCRIHSLDSKRIESIIEGKGQGSKLRQFHTDAEIMPLANECGDLIDGAQRRLTATCSKFGFLTMHQLAYTFSQLSLIVMDFTGDIYHTDGMDLDDERFRKLGYSCWHLAIAVVGLAGLLIIPAATTATFDRCFHSVYLGLRKRGASERLSVQMASDMSFQIEGFTLMTAQVSFKSVGLFLSIVFTCFSVYIELDNR
mmetsp:Transcript_3111/g.8804  ORF Transcript_3111/g.8804 Transcript_3111/m.8804 type:complete len:335 (+) Transcript_3111:966-1970(+)